jgi:hypothetical protein
MPKCSDLTSVLDKIQVAFPWYRHMHALMGTSPIVTRVAVPHSTTSINLDILDRNSALNVGEMNSSLRYSLQ